MNVHNLMEDVVIQSVNSLYDQIKANNNGWLSCDCQNCRLDTISFVLNRIHPKYVVSGRGVNHSVEEMTSQQLKADIDSLALAGIRIVNSTKRPYHTQPKNLEVTQNSIPAFNFFTFTGSVLDGTNFEPVPNAQITLKYEGQPAQMIDSTWSNPYTTCKTTKGTYSFLVKPLKAEKEGITKKFNFCINVTAPDYAGTDYHFEVSLTSDKNMKNDIDSTYSLKLNDIIIFKKDIENPME